MPYDETSWTCPKAEGLYDPSLERDACGVGFIVHIDGKTTHQVLVDAQELSRRFVLVRSVVCTCLTVWCSG